MLKFVKLMSNPSRFCHNPSEKLNINQTNLQKIVVYSTILPSVAQTYTNTHGQTSLEK